MSAIAILAVPFVTSAQESSGQPLWEIGAAGAAVSQLAYPGASQHVNHGLALPFLIYRGEYLRVDRSGAGIRAIKTSNFELDVGVAGSFGSSSNDIEARRGMPDLGTFAEFGPRLTWHLGLGPGNGQLRAEFPLRGVFDLSDHLALKGVAFEPELVFVRRSQAGWNYRTGVGAVFGDKRLADTFYGVASSYATAGRPSYVAEGGLVAWRLSTSLFRKLSPDWRLFGFARLETVGGAANQSSPLVQSKTGASVGLGFTYTWMRSESQTTD